MKSTETADGSAIDCNSLLGENGRPPSTGSGDLSSFVSPKVRRTSFSPHSRHRSASHALQRQRDGPRLTSKHAWQYQGNRSSHPPFIPSWVSVKNISPPVHRVCSEQHPFCRMTPRHSGTRRHTTAGVRLSVKVTQLLFFLMSCDCILGYSEQHRSFPLGTHSSPACPSRSPR